MADTAIKIDQPHRAKEMLRDAAATGNARALQLLYLAAAKDGDEQLALSIQKKGLGQCTKGPPRLSHCCPVSPGKGGVWLQEQILNVSMKSVKSDGDLYVQMAGMFTQNFKQARASGDEKDAQAWLDLADKALTFAEEMNVKAWRYRFAHAGVFALKGKHKEASDIIDELARQEPKNELISYCRGHLRTHSNNPAAMAKTQFEDPPGGNRQTSCFFKCAGGYDYLGMLARLLRQTWLRLSHGRFGVQVETFGRRSLCKGNFRASGSRPDRPPVGRHRGL